MPGRGACRAAAACCLPLRRRRTCSSPRNCSARRPEDFRGQIGTMPRYVMSGHMVYAQNRNLMAVPFDLRAMDASQGQAGDSGGQRHLAGRASGAQFSVSENGSLAYVLGPATTPSNRLVWVSRTGAVQPLNAPARTTTTSPESLPTATWPSADVIDGPPFRSGCSTWIAAHPTPLTFDGYNRAWESGHGTRSA